MQAIRKYFQTELFSPFSLILVTTIIVFSFVFMEWLFLITKPSFLDLSLFSEIIFILLTAGSLLSAICILAMLPFVIVAIFWAGGKVHRLLGMVYSIIPALVLTCLLLLLIDNFTYTLFKFGIVSAQGIWRAVYAVLFTAVLVLIYKKVLQFSTRMENHFTRRLKISQELALGILAVFLVASVFIPVKLYSGNSDVSVDIVAPEKLTKKPNIILITADGLNAEKLSVYGYEKETTPFLKNLAKTSLVAKNAFSNAQGTIGSTASFLTGRYPADIRVLHSTDILKGEDATRHLPGLLKNQGYYTVQLSDSYYADAYRMNIQAGFSEANGQKMEGNPIYAGIARLLPTNYYYFLHEVLSRLTDRLEHIFFIRDMSNPYVQVTEAPKKFKDQQKLDYALTLLADKELPLFIHIHWMGTHGPRYFPDKQFFSIGKDPDAQEKYDEDFYNDSILEFDGALSSFYHELEIRNLLENSIIIIASDHTQKWTASRLPLIIHYAGSAIGNEIPGNVQNLDIAPTILDYLGATQPKWMAGQSLLTSLDPARPIFLSAIPASVKDKTTGKVSYPDPEPPFFQFGKVTAVICNKWYRVNTEKMILDVGTVIGYKGECDDGDMTEQTALELIAAHLQTYGFDTSTLRYIETDN